MAGRKLSDDTITLPYIHYQVLSVGVGTSFTGNEAEILLAAAQRYRGQ